MRSGAAEAAIWCLQKQEVGLCSLFVLYRDSLRYIDTVITCTPYSQNLVIQIIRIGDTYDTYTHESCCDESISLLKPYVYIKIS